MLTVVSQRASAQYKQAGEWARAGEVFAKMGDIAKRQVLPELLKVADVQTHVCAKFSRTCKKCVLFNAKQEKQAFYE